MNKKLFFGLFAATGMLFATSCSDDELQSIQSGNEAQVTFALGLEGGIASRAISDGMSVDKLIYAVYDADNKLITTIAGSDNGELVKDNAFQNGLTENVNITLAKGQTYTVVFWAQDESCNAYTVTTEADGIKVAVDYNGQNNDETRDAFFKAETFKVSGNAQLNVTLKRPFAQVNVGVTKADWDAAVASGIDVEKSKVVIKNAATAINLLDGTVTGETAVDYYLATIPAKFDTEEVLTVDVNSDGTISEDENFKYLSMSYILTAAEKTTLESDGLQFTFSPVNGEDIVFDEGLHNVPVQRNWRTNILGKILTGDIEFNIVINPIYDGEYNNGEAKPVSINGVYYATIQDAINNAKAGDVISVATGTYPEVLDVKGGKNLTIEAAGSNVVVAAIGHQSNGNPSTITVKGVTFDNSITPAGWFTGTAQNIAPCVGAWGGFISFEDCKFIVAGTSGKETGVMTWWTGDKLMTLSFNNCTFEGLNNHASARAMQIYGTVNMDVTNCTFNTYKDYTLKYVANEGNIANFSNNVVNNSENFVELGSSVYPGKKYTANITNNTLGVGVNTHVIANAEEQTVNVDGNVTQVAEGLILNENNQYVALNDAGLNNAIQGGQTTIYLEAGSFIIPDAAQRKTLKFIGTGNPNDTKIATQDDGSYEGCDYSLDGATVTFENISINTDSRTYTGYARCSGTYINCVINGTYTLYGKSTFERCTFNVTGDVYNIWTWGAKEATFDKCTFNCDGKSLLVYNQNLDITLNSCTFNDNGNISGKAAIETGVDNGNTKYTIKINDTKVNGFDVTGQNAVTYGGTNLGTNVWGNKNLITAENLDVIIDGVTVY